MKNLASPLNLIISRHFGLPSVHITYPLVASASLAVMATSQPHSYDCTTPCDFRGSFAELEPGLGGGKLSLGWARVGGAGQRRDRLLHRVDGGDEGPWMVIGGAGWGF